MLEPYVGHSLGTVKATGASTHPNPTVAGRSVEGTLDGYDFGSRLAVMWGRLMVGGDFNLTEGRLTLNGTSESTKWHGSAGWLMLGFRFDWGLKVAVYWPPYYYVHTKDSDYKGTGYKAGIGYQFEGPIGFDVEYEVYDIEKVKTSGQNSYESIATKYTQFDYSAIVAHITFPIDLLLGPTKGVHWSRPAYGEDDPGAASAPEPEPETGDEPQEKSE